MRNHSLSNRCQRKPNNERFNQKHELNCLGRKGLDLTQAFSTSEIAAAKDKAVAAAFIADTTTKYAADGKVDAAAGQTAADLQTAIGTAADDAAAQNIR